MEGKKPIGVLQDGILLVNVPKDARCWVRQCTEAPWFRAIILFPGGLLEIQNVMTCRKHKDDLTDDVFDAVERIFGDQIRKTLEERGYTFDRKSSRLAWEPFHSVKIQVEE